MLRRFLKLQRQWRTSLLYLNWTIILIATIISLWPIFVNCTQQRNGYPSGYFADILNNSSFAAPVNTDTVLSIITDDDIVRGTSDLEYTMIMGPFLGLCLSPLLDLFVDVYVAITQPTMEMNTNNPLKIVRLTLLERFVFVVGIVCSALYFFLPLDWNVMILYTVRQVTTNLNNLLSTAPIIMFLERTTSIFSPFFTTLVLFFLSLGTTMSCYQYNIAKDTIIFGKINVDYQYILLGTYILILSACLWSLVQSFYSSHEKLEETTKKKLHLDPFHMFSVNHVPACHSFALCLICVVNMSWYLSVTKYSTSTTNLLYMLQLFASALVFVIEMRIRQNEIMHGLHLLHSKRAFVRFISHEIRTPLSTASMGLELLSNLTTSSSSTTTTTIPTTNTKKTVNGMHDAIIHDEHDVLWLVQESIRLSVSVFDHLIQYDALDHNDDEMALHYQSINAANMMNVVIAPMALEACRKDVMLSGNLVDLRRLSPTASSAMVDVDERRIAQCIRSLVSGAIALTPKVQGIR